MMLTVERHAAGRTPRAATVYIHLGHRRTATVPPPPSFSLASPTCEEGGGGGGVRQRLLKYSELSLSTLSINYQNMCERWPG